MEEKVGVERKEPPRGGSRRPTTIRYAPEVKLKAVRLVLEQGYSRNLVSREIGVCKTSLETWIGKYQDRWRRKRYISENTMWVTPQ